MFQCPSTAMENSQVGLVRQALQRLKFVTANDRNFQQKTLTIFHVQI